MGYETIPHIAAKKIKNREEAYELSNELCKYCTKVFIIGGSDKQEGAFKTVGELVSTGAFDNFRIGVGGFPEGNGSLSYEKGISILKQKTSYASFVVTQWSLDKKVIKRFLDDSPLPVYLGIPNSCKIPQLINFAKACGIGDSLKGFMGIEYKTGARFWGVDLYESSVQWKLYCHALSLKQFNYIHIQIGGTKHPYYFTIREFSFYPYREMRNDIINLANEFIEFFILNNLESYINEQS